jgi:hypothetical protein
MSLTSLNASSECLCRSDLAEEVGSGTLSGLSSVSACPGEARCLSPSRCLPIARPDGPPPVRTTLEEPAVAGQRERDAVVSSPLRHLPDVASSRDEDCHEAVPEAMEGDARDPCTCDGRPPHSATEQAACQGAAPRGREDQRVGLWADVVRKVLLKSTYHRPGHRDGALGAGGLWLHRDGALGRSHQPMWSRRSACISSHSSTAARR